MTRQGCDSDVTCYLENQTETEWGLKWETEEQMEKQARMVQRRVARSSLPSATLLFVHRRPHSTGTLEHLQRLVWNAEWTLLFTMSCQQWSVGCFPNQFVFNWLQLWNEMDRSHKYKNSSWTEAFGFLISSKCNVKFIWAWVDICCRFIHSIQVI